MSASSEKNPPTPQAPLCSAFPSSTPSPAAGTKPYWLSVASNTSSADWSVIEPLFSTPSLSSPSSTEWASPLALNTEGSALASREPLLADSPQQFLSFSPHAHAAGNHTETKQSIRLVSDSQTASGSLEGAVDVMQTSRQPCQPTCSQRKVIDSLDDDDDTQGGGHKRLLEAPKESDLAAPSPSSGTNWDRPVTEDFFSSPSSSSPSSDQPNEHSQQAQCKGLEQEYCLKSLGKRKLTTGPSTLARGMINGLGSDKEKVEDRPARRQGGATCTRIEGSLETPKEGDFATPSPSSGTAWDQAVTTDFLSLSASSAPMPLAPMCSAVNPPTQTEEGPYKCSWAGCDAAYTSRDDIHVPCHGRTHVGEHPSTSEAKAPVSFPSSTCSLLSSTISEATVVHVLAEEAAEEMASASPAPSQPPATKPRAEKRRLEISDSVSSKDNKEKRSKAKGSLSEFGPVGMDGKWSSEEMPSQAVGVEGHELEAATVLPNSSLFCTSHAMNGQPDTIASGSSTSMDKRGDRQGGGEAQDMTQRYQVPCLDAFLTCPLSPAPVQRLLNFSTESSSNASSSSYSTCTCKLPREGIGLLHVHVDDDKELDDQLYPLEEGGKGSLEGPTGSLEAPKESGLAAPSPSSGTNWDRPVTEDFFSSPSSSSPSSDQPNEHSQQAQCTCKGLKQEYCLKSLTPKEDGLATPCPSSVIPWDRAVTTDFSSFSASSAPTSASELTSLLSRSRRAGLLPNDASATAMEKESDANMSRERGLRRQRSASSDSSSALEAAKISLATRRHGRSAASSSSTFFFSLHSSSSNPKEGRSLHVQETNKEGDVTATSFSGDIAWARAVTTNPSYHSSVMLASEEIVFGRQQGCNVQLNHAAISKKHCKITRDLDVEEQAVWLTDLSTNGTYANGVLLGKNQRCRLTHGMEFVLTKTPQVGYLIDLKRTTF